jgi:hypothetical protein
MKNFMIAFTLIFCTSFVAEARMPTYYSPATNRTYTYTNIQSMGSDQDRCQAEANYMAANNIMGHVGGTIGRFEGVGYGGTPNCNTCVPSSRMTPTGDASAQGRNGMWYRVRSWR